MRRFLSIMTALVLISVSALPVLLQSVAAENTSVKPIINNYDESNATYTNHGVFSGLGGGDDDITYTSRTVNGNTIEHFSSYMTIVDNSVYKDTYGNSARFGCSENGKKYFKKFERIWIYDSNDENLGIFTPKANTTYKISLEWRNDVTLNGKEMRLALAQSSCNDEPNSENHELLIDNILVNLVTLPAYSVPSSDWTIAEASFTTGEDPKPLMLMVYSNNDWYGVIDLFVDNITITEIVPGGKNTEISFDGQQATFYNDNPVTNTSKIGSVIKTDDKSHNNVMHFKRLHVYRNDGYENQAPYNTVLEPTMFLLSDSQGYSRVEYEQGDLLEVSFEMKKNKAIEADAFDDITVALVFAESYSKDGSKNNIRDYVNNNQTVTLTSVDKNADSDWVTYHSYAVVPYTGYGAFMIYGKVWEAVCDIDIDNVKVSVVEDAQTKVTLHNADYSDSSSKEEVSVSMVQLIEDLPSPYCEEAKFVGWYTDSELKNAASSYVGSTTDLWAKWTTDKTKIVNNYSEEGIYYSEYVTDNGYTMTTKTVGENSDILFGQFGVQVLSNEKYGESGNSVAFSYARTYNWNWPALVKIFDNNTSDFSDFVPDKNSAYRLKFRYRADAAPGKMLYIQLRRLGRNGSSFYNTEQIYLDNIVSISNKTSGWQEVSVLFYTGSEVSELALQLVSSDADLYPVSDVDVRIADVEIEEVFNAASICFNTNGGTKINKLLTLVGEEVPAFQIPAKSNQLFDGWFLDKEFTKPFTYDVMPDKNITVYAKWVDPISDAILLETSFETVCYRKEQVSDNICSQEVCQNFEDGYTGEACLSITTDSEKVKTSSWVPAVSFVNDDGSSFQVVKNGRYRMKFMMRCSKSANIFLLVSEQVPSSGVNFMNSTQISNLTYTPLFSGCAPENQWQMYELYFIPEVTGKVYFTTLTGNVTIDIDDLSIETVPETVASKVTYYNGNTVVKTCFGKVGELLLDPTMDSITGDNPSDFNGWYDKDGALYIGSEYPDHDMELYASYEVREDIENTKLDWTNKITVDFEDKEGAKIFYGRATGFDYGTGYISDDAEGAHSGTGYYKLKNIGVWDSRWYRRMKFYIPDSDGNQIYLDPLSIYKVGFWINVEVAGSSDISVAAFDGTDSMQTYNKSTVIPFIESEQIKNIGKWVYYEKTVSTGEDVSVLGLVFSGGYMTAAIDDVTVEKMKIVTISFDTNGGTEIAPIEALTNDYAVSPMFPEKEGYEFAGWYSDKELTQKFKFNTMPIMSSMTLYAKWTPIFVPETKYKTTVTYQTETEEQANPEYDEQLDNQLEITNEEEVVSEQTKDSQAEPDTDTSDNNYIVWIIAGAAVIAVAITAILLIIRRKKAV